jgi:CheY-like chemotaxis protein
MTRLADSLMIVPGPRAMAHVGIGAKLTLIRGDSMTEPATLREMAGGAHPRRVRRLRILVVDDNEVLRTAVQGLLRQMGHSTDAARDGLEALEAAAGRAYDVVMLDVQMPGMGGFEASRSLSQGRPNGGRPRIIGFSGEPEDEQSYRAAGMDDFLIKPVRPADLARALDGPLRGRMGPTGGDPGLR